MLVIIRTIWIINYLLLLLCKNVKVFFDKNGLTDFYNNVELFTGINNGFVHEYLNVMLV